MKTIIWSIQHPLYAFYWWKNKRCYSDRHLGKWVACLVLAAILAGCSTSQQTVALQASSGTDAAVRLAMVGWGAYVQQAHPGTNAETQVKLAFKTVQNAELGVIDAATELSTNAMATNQAVAAQIIFNNAQAFLLKTISTYTNSTH